MDKIENYTRKAFLQLITEICEAQGSETHQDQLIHN